MTLVPHESTLRRTVILVALLNLGYFGIEFAVALAIGSVSLFADSIDFIEDTAKREGIDCGFSRLDGFLVASPANPTGSMLSPDELDALIAWCDAAGVRFLSIEPLIGAVGPVDLLVVEGAGHYEMYDEPAYVDQAIERLTAFFTEYLPPELGDHPVGIR